MGITRFLLSKNKKVIKEKQLKIESFRQNINDTIEENNLIPLYAKKCHNFSVKNGALVSGVGVSTLTFPDENGEETALPTNVPNYLPKRMFRFYNYNDIEKIRFDWLFVYHEDGHMAWTPYTTPFRAYRLVSDFNFTSPPTYLPFKLPSGERACFFSSETDGLYLYGNITELTAITNVPKLSSICMHYGRIFASVFGDKMGVWISKNIDPTTWKDDETAGEMLVFEDDLGATNKVLSFNNYVYAIREYGITRLSSFSSKDDINVMNIYVGSSYIFYKTATVINDNLFFLCSDGLYTFDGVNTRKIELKCNTIFENLNQSNAKAVCYHNKYCLIANSSLGVRDLGVNEFIMKNDNDTLFMYDTITKDYEIFVGSYITDIEPIQSGELERLGIITKRFVSNDIKYFKTDLKMVVDGLGAVDNVPTKKVWESGESNLGTRCKKYFTFLTLVTHYPCQVEITCEGKSRVLSFLGSENSQKKRIDLSGESVAIKITSQTQNAFISSPCLNYMEE